MAMGNQPMGGVDLLSGGLDSLLDIGMGANPMAQPPQMNSNPMVSFSRACFTKKNVFFK